MVNVKRATETLAKLALMKFFPADADARNALVGIACEMAESNEQIDWLARRMLALYNEWPGPKELRACFCSRFKPRDGIEVYSEKFIDGIPSEKKPEPMKALPSGQVASVDRGADNAVRLLAVSKGFDKRHTVRAKTPEVPVNPTARPITQADVNAAVEANRDARARAELGEPA